MKPIAFSALFLLTVASAQKPCCGPMQIMTGNGMMNGGGSEGGAGDGGGSGVGWWWWWGRLSIYFSFVVVVVYVVLVGEIVDYKDYNVIKYWR